MLGGVVMKLKTKEASKKINPREVLKERRNYSDVVHEELEERGVDFFKPSDDGGSLHIDVDYLSLPQNITDISARDLGEHLNAFTQQKMYMRTLVGYTEALMEEARRDYLEVSNPRYQALLNTKLSETAKEREVNSNPKVLPYYEKYTDYKIKAKLLNLNIQSIEEAIFMLSREVSRRTGDYENERRDYNVQQRR